MNYEFTFRGNPSEELRRIKSKAADDHIDFVGDTKEGTFAGGAATLGDCLNGIYGIVDNRIFVTVLNKPPSSSWNQVKNMLKGFIEK